MTLVLASASESRAKVLRGAGITFEIEPASVDEDAVKREMLAAGRRPADVALALAEKKAQSVSAKRGETLVLGADQVADMDGVLLSKCASLAELEDLLRRLRARTHELVSAVALARAGKVLWRHVDTSRLVMRGFSDTFLRDYLAKEGPSLLSGLGGYRLEGRGIQLFETVEGDYFSILGLPLLPVLAKLRELGEIDG